MPHVALHQHQGKTDMHGSLEVKMPADKIYERMTADLPINSQVAPAVVDDPLEHGAKLRVLRSVRDDPLAGMHSRGQIDDAMLAAGRRWQMHHEHSEIGGISAIDPCKEAVDGGRIPEPITDRQIKAIRQLAEADQILGFQGKLLVRQILGERKSVQDVSMRLGLTTQREFNYMSRRFRECLESLAKLWGFAG